MRRKKQRHAMKMYRVPEQMYVQYDIRVWKISKIFFALNCGHYLKSFQSIENFGKSFPSKISPGILNQIWANLELIATEGFFVGNCWLGS